VLLLSFQSGGNYTTPVNKAITLHNDFAVSTMAMPAAGPKLEGWALVGGY
jgi:hypothetical protein